MKNAAVLVFVAFVAAGFGTGTAKTFVEFLSDGKCVKAGKRIGTPFGNDEVWPANEISGNPYNTEKCGGTLKDRNSHFFVMKEDYFGGPDNWFWPLGDLQTTGSSASFIEVQEYREKDTNSICALSFEGDFRRANNAKSGNSFKIVESTLTIFGLCSDSSETGCETPAVGVCGGSVNQLVKFQYAEGHIQDSGKKCKIVKEKAAFYGPGASGKTDAFSVAMWFKCEGYNEINDFNFDLSEPIGGEECPPVGGEEIPDSPACLTEMQVGGDVFKCDAAAGPIEGDPHGLYLGGKRLQPEQPLETNIAYDGSGTEYANVNSFSFQGVFIEKNGEQVTAELHVEVEVSEGISYSEAVEIYGDPRGGSQGQVGLEEFEIKGVDGKCDRHEDVPDDWLEHLRFFRSISGKLTFKDPILNAKAGDTCTIRLKGGPVMLGNGGNLHTYDSSASDTDSGRISWASWFYCDFPDGSAFGGNKALDFNMDFGPCPAPIEGEECEPIEEEPPLCIAPYGYDEEKDHFFWFRDSTCRYFPANSEKELPLRNPTKKSQNPEYALIPSDSDEAEVFGFVEFSFRGRLKCLNCEVCGGPLHLDVDLTFSQALRFDDCKPNGNCPKLEDGVEMATAEGWVYYKLAHGSIRSPDASIVPGHDNSFAQYFTHDKLPQAGYQAQVKPNALSDGFSSWFKYSEHGSSHEGDINARFKICEQDVGGEEEPSFCTFPKISDRDDPYNCVPCGSADQDPCPKKNKLGLPPCKTGLVKKKIELEQTNSLGEVKKVDVDTCVRCGNAWGPICSTDCNDCQVFECRPRTEPDHENGICVPCGIARWQKEEDGQSWTLYPQCTSSANVGVVPECQPNFIPIESNGKKLCSPCGGLGNTQLEVLKQALKDLGFSEILAKATCSGSCNQDKPFCKPRYITVDDNGAGKARFLEKNGNDAVVEFIQDGEGECSSPIPFGGDLDELVCEPCGNGFGSPRCSVPCGDESTPVPACNGVFGDCRNRANLVASKENPSVCDRCGTDDNDPVCSDGECRRSWMNVREGRCKFCGLPFDEFGQEACDEGDPCRRKFNVAIDGKCESCGYWKSRDENGVFIVNENNEYVGEPVCECEEEIEDISESGCECPRDWSIADGATCGPCGMGHNEQPPCPSGHPRTPGCMGGRIEVDGKCFILGRLGAPPAQTCGENNQDQCPCFRNLIFSEDENACVCPDDLEYDESANRCVTYNLRRRV